MNIPMLDLRREYAYMKTDIDAAIQRCLEHQKWILGPEVKELEEKTAAYLGTAHCIGTSSGTESLLLALRALALTRKGEEYFSRNDKIITTPLTFTATGDAILRSGATPVFVDIDPATFNLDPDRIAACLSQTPGIVGIVPVHLYGRSCAMDTILELARRHKLFVVEDVAQAFGAAFQGKKLGTLGDLGAFSFFPSKNLGGFGDGGMVATNDARLAETVRVLTKHGGKDKNNAEHIGYNARLDTLQAAILLAKLKHLDEFNQRRRAIAQIYNQNFSGIAGILLPSFSEDHVYHQYTLRILNARREVVQKGLKEDGIDTMIYYSVLLSRMKLFAGRSETPQRLTHAEQAEGEVLSLPIEPLFTDKEVAEVSARVSRRLRQEGNHQ